MHVRLEPLSLSHLAALAEIGRGVLAARVQVRSERLSALAGADRTVADLSRKAAITLRALDAYDRDAVKQGRGIAVFVAGALLLLIAAKFAL